jgi:hypothetical protein
VSSRRNLSQHFGAHKKKHIILYRAIQVVLLGEVKSSGISRCLGIVTVGLRANQKARAMNKRKFTATTTPTADDSTRENSYSLATREHHPASSNSIPNNPRAGRRRSSDTCCTLRLAPGWLAEALLPAGVLAVFVDAQDSAPHTRLKNSTKSRFRRGREVINSFRHLISNKVPRQ